MLLQRIRDVQRVGTRNLRRANRVDACRHLVDIDSRAGDRRRRCRLDKNPAYVPGGGGPRRTSTSGAADWFGGWPRRNYLDGGQYLVASWCGLGLSSVISGNET